jgi:hypothetical protein
MTRAALKNVTHLPGKNNPNAPSTSNPKKKSAKTATSRHAKRSIHDGASGPRTKKQLPRATTVRYRMPAIALTDLGLQNSHGKPIIEQNPT